MYSRGMTTESAKPEETGDGTTTEWRPLSRRLAGLPHDDTLYEGVPDHLYSSLNKWRFDRFYEDEGLVEKVRLRLRLKDVQPNRVDLLDIIDAILKWSTRYYDEKGVGDTPEEKAENRWWDIVEPLDDALELGGSAWRVNAQLDGLERRLDEIVHDAADQATDAAAPEPATHLRNAWSATYGRNPDPTTAYSEAVKAVEAAACPLVLPKSTAAGKATLGNVLGELKGGQRNSWALAIDGKNSGAIDPLIAMMELLWNGQVARHAAATHSRPMRQDEAEMAVHLAATLVHWLSTNAMRKR